MDKADVLRQRSDLADTIMGCMPVPVDQARRHRAAATVDDISVSRPRPRGDKTCDAAALDHDVTACLLSLSKMRKFVRTVGRPGVCARISCGTRPDPPKMPTTAAPPPTSCRRETSASSRRIAVMDFADLQRPG
ncbi:MAG: hypothetical protein ACK4NE_01480 [Albidovulum sp.]